LSPFAGAARELDGALIVNPYDLDGVADAIAEAVSMPLGDRQARWESMMAQLRSHDITAWRRGYLEALAAA
ncbi:MAG TPA: trehalose-6-phosphate synthase, partial [Lysobacter sp.]